MPLTDVAIRKAKPTDSPVRLFDGGGLYLEIVPSGGKWWRLKYRHGGKEKRLSLGTFLGTGLKKARDARDMARQQIAAGIDPSAERKTAKETLRLGSLNSLERVARAWLAHRSKAWTPGTLVAITASLETHVFPRLGDRPVSEVQPREIRDVVQAVEAAGASETAGRVFQRLRSIYRYAVAQDVSEMDPTYPLKPSEILKPRRVQHRASLGKKVMPAFLSRLGQYEGEPSTVSALMLLVLTATRPGELRAN